MNRLDRTYKIEPRPEKNCIQQIIALFACGLVLAALFFSALSAAALITLIITRPAKAHDHWINYEHLTDPVSGEWCCNENDCHPVNDVKEVPGGYSVRGEFIPEARVIWKSRDGRWWQCQHPYGEKQGKTRCLIGMPPGS
jgi:hypothetical protein